MLVRGRRRSIRRARPSWEQNYALRLRFERAAYTAYRSIGRSITGHRKYARVVYRVVVPVYDYEPRTIEMHFRRTSPQPALSRVYADGPTDSPHRYAPHHKDRLRRPSLCIWHPDDPDEKCWVPSDGLLTLIEMTRVHLFKEVLLPRDRRVARRGGLSPPVAREQDMLIAASQAAASGEDWKLIAALIAAAIAFLAHMIVLLVNGRRARRERLQELYAGGWAAVQAYGLST